MQDSNRQRWEAAAQRVVGERPLESLGRTVAGDVRLEAMHDDRPPAPTLGIGQRSAMLRATRWQVRARIAAGDPAQADAAIAEALRAGADAIEWVPAFPGTAGVRVADGDGASTALATATANDTPVYVRSGAMAGPWWVARTHAAREHGKPARGGVLAAPLGALAADGCLPGPIARCWDDIAACVRDSEGVLLDVVLCTALPAHDAGADAVTSLGFLLAQLSATRRALSERGVEPEAWLQRAWIELGADGDALTAIATVRAARAVHARWLATEGVVAADFPARLHVATTRTGLARHDPWTNLLRSNAEAAAAAIGGADAITLPAWDEGIGDAESAPRRLALTMQAVLQREGHLRRVADPAAGAYAIEHLTDGIARGAWAFWQEIEAAGGLLAALASGTVQRRVRADRNRRERAIATRKEAVIGVSVTPNLTEPPPAPRGRALLEPTDARPIDGVRDLGAAALALRTGTTLVSIEASLAAGDGPTEACMPLQPFRAAAAWEAQRDGLVAQGEAAAAVYVAALGPLRNHKARTDFARELLGAGGFAVVGGDGDGFANADAAAAAFAGSRAEIVAICGSDAHYAELAAPVARALSRFAPRAIVLMGRPGELEPTLREAGVTHFAYLGCDALALLAELSPEVTA